MIKLTNLSHTSYDKYTDLIINLLPRNFRKRDSSVTLHAKISELPRKVMGRRSYLLSLISSENLRNVEESRLLSRENVSRSVAGTRVVSYRNASSRCLRHAVCHAALGFLATYYRARVSKETCGISCS